MSTYDFSGWATRNDMRCSDGRTIRKNAFAHCDGNTVPLVWNHDHKTPDNVLGKVVLKNVDEGVMAYGTFNDTPSGRGAKELVRHGDITALSIYANQLKQNGGDVMHGNIREVSLVYAGANPGAYIVDVEMAHSDDEGYSAEIFPGEEVIFHAEETNNTEEVTEVAEEVKHADEAENNGETIGEMYESMPEKYKKLCAALVGLALESKGEATHSEENDEEETIMHRNCFDEESQVSQDEVLTHSEMTAIISDAKRYGSMKESALQHGITNIEYLFPDAKNVTTTPEWIKRDDTWVDDVMGKTHHTPYSRIKSMFANITEDEARARGYIKGKLKKEEVFSLLKRTTDPQTVYKKQKLDRDDVIDITDFDVVAWMKTEMRWMLDEELARAILVGDGRMTSDDDHISHDHIRPIWTDADLYTIKKTITVANNATEDQIAKAAIRAAIKARKDYKGSGNPVLFTTEDYLTDMLLLEDNNGRTIYDNQAQLATKLRVSKIVTVPVMEGLKRNTDDGEVELMGIIVNLTDYNVGADKGGSVNMFDDFDIDYNQMKYLMETRCSGALIKPYSAIALELKKASA